MTCTVRSPDPGRHDRRPIRPHRGHVDWLQDSTLIAPVVTPWVSTGTLRPDIARTAGRAGDPA